MPAANPRLPAPRMPKVSRVTSVDQVMPALRIIVKRKRGNQVEGFDLKPGQKVLIVTDQTVDPLLPEALKLAIAEAGGQTEVIELEGFPALKEPVELVDNQFSTNWFPDWVWDKALQADVFVHLAFLKPAHTPNLPTEGLARPVALGWELPLDLMNDDYFGFPIELRDAAAKKTWAELKGARVLELKDALGTDLVFQYQPEEWEDQGKAYHEYEGGRWGHLSIPLPRRAPHGQLVVTSLTFGGPVPETTLVISGRQIVEVHGGGLFGERLKESFETYKDHVYPGQREPKAQGANWMSTFGICMHPKARPSPFFREMSGSGRIHAWSIGHRRSGIIHTAIGMAIDNPKKKVIRHVDIQFATIVADGKVIIENGHITALDDPEVRDLASRYGDPDKLLREDWIPEVVTE